ncbi:DUF2239 family protein [Achromobacter spanius]|uniref:DUF2239 domain-containing protein n=1 Tax=Achromobacter spanius TaxID=217203 RepID=A0AAW3HXC0_9BURK|nr:DUF2239 family protein [Achromobacter spanius]KNE24371.1 hypothetical protein AFM18_25545 [Achromobacter spanius]
MNLPAPNIAPTNTYTAFEGQQILAAGPLADVALAVKRAMDSGAAHTMLVYQDGTGIQTDLNLAGTDAQIIERHRQPVDAANPGSAPSTEPDDSAEPREASHHSALHPRGRGRPKLGVVPREVTLLPRHWDWLAQQPGGASVALRKLVEQARRDNDTQDQQRQRQEAAYRFMSSMAGNLPGFEEATRALYANDRERFAQCVAAWPQDVRAYATRLAWQAASDTQARH